MACTSMWSVGGAREFRQVYSKVDAYTSALYQTRME